MKILTKRGISDWHYNCDTVQCMMKRLLSYDICQAHFFSQCSVSYSDDFSTWLVMLTKCFHKGVLHKGKGSFQLKKNVSKKTLDTNNSIVYRLYIFKKYMYLKITILTIWWLSKNHIISDDICLHSKKN